MSKASDTSITPTLWQRLERIAFIALLRITSWLPLSASRKIGSFLGAVAYRIVKKRVHIVRVNLQICFPQWSDEERERCVKECIKHAGMWFMEVGAVWFWPKEKLLKLVTIDNPQMLQTALATHQSVIIAAPHLGNWELLGPLISRDNEFACFYKHDEKSPLISNLVRDNRARLGITMAPANASGVRILYKHLKAGKIAGILPDHIPTEEMGVFAPFYNRLALTGTLTSSLARKSKAIVLVTTAIRTDTGFAVRYLPVKHQHSDDEVLAATGLNAAIEQAIALAPEQFQWVYPRFKRRPDPKAEPSPYR